MSARGRPDLGRTRGLGALINDALGVYLAHFRTFIVLAATIVVPAELVVGGIGLEQLTSGYDESTPLGEALISPLVGILVVLPLINATCIHALRAVAESGSPRAREALTAGFEEFTPIFLAVVLAAAGVALGLLALVIPGVYLAVRWFFVPQTVVLEGARGVGALRRSGELVQGVWWRTFGVLLAANLLAAVPSLLLAAPFEALAQETDRAVFSLAGTALSQTLTAPFVALLSTLLYFDTRTRKAPV